MSILFFIFFCLIPPSHINAQTAELPQKKVGLGLGVGWLYDYPGAAQGRMRFLPFPVYRGRLFRMDRISGVSGDVYQDSRLDFSWNFIFQFPTQSRLIPVREGMPDLDWLLSLGPELKYVLYRSGHHNTFFRFPVRMNSCTNFSDRTRFCGISFNPGVRHVYRNQMIGEVTFRAEAFSHSTEYNQYFYEVRPEFATIERPQYSARAGFLGFVYGFFHSYPFDGWELSTSANIYDYSMAINQWSPLFIHKTNYAAFITISVDLY
jgi:MipA family protein